MSFRTGLVTYLRAQVPSVSNRIYPLVLPNTFTPPSVVYSIVTDLAGYSHDGPIELHNPRIQIDVWSRSILEAERVADEVERAMLGYQGPMGEVEYTAGWRLDTTTDIYENDTKLYRVSSDFRGWYQPQEVS